MQNVKNVTIYSKKTKDIIHQVNVQIVMKKELKVKNFGQMNKPNYKNGSIVNVTNTILKHFNKKTVHSPINLKLKKKVVMHPVLFGNQGASGPYILGV